MVRATGGAVMASGKRNIAPAQRAERRTVWIWQTAAAVVKLPAMRELKELRVTVDDVIYMPTLDAPEDKPHPFVYFISIRNDSDEEVTILGRKWVVQEGEEIVVVEGDGVVGQTPTLAPGGHFSYNSYHVTSGDAVVEGAFFGRVADGTRVFTRIPEFRLEVPGWA